MKKDNKKALLIAITIPLLVGVISAIITKDSMSIFDNVTKPPLSPPSILFPIAWTILYILMGLASYYIYINNDYMSNKYRRNSLILYVLQLIFNFFWSIIFFNMKAYFIAFIWLIIMWILIILLMINARLVDKKAYYLLIPYIIWTTFAAYLNIGIALLN